MNIPNISGPIAAPKSIPEYTIPYTLPEAPIGVAERIIKSRDGAATPSPVPNKTNRMAMKSIGSQPLAINKVIAIPIDRQIDTTFSEALMRLAI